MEHTLKITTKGQVTFRKNVLAHLGVRPGDALVVDLLPEGRAEVRAPGSRSSITEFFGCLQQPGTIAISIEEMNDIISRGWTGEG